MSADSLQEFLKTMREPAEEAIAFRGLLTGETDRGCALLAASYLEHSLLATLRARLVEDDDVAETLFRPDGPLGSLSARIDLAYMVGLIGKAVRRDLHLVRKIRNEFGHSPTTVSFDDPEIAARCREMQHTNLEANAKSRHFFTNTVMGLAAVIHVRRVTGQHFEPAKDRVPDESNRRISREWGGRIADEVIDELVREVGESTPSRASITQKITQTFERLSTGIVEEIRRRESEQDKSGPENPLDT